MKFIVLGTTEFTLNCARSLIDAGNDVCALVSIFEHLTPLNSADIKGFAKANGILYHEVEDINSPAAVNFLKSLEPDFIFSSWPKIFKKDVLSIPKRFCIGSHPTDLPYNRGRHPLHWLIALGHPDTKVSFFKMDEGVDSGNLLLQIPLMIEPSDKIDKVVDKMNTAAYAGLKQLSKKLVEDPLYEGKKQDHEKANYWRKRSVHDTVLDMRMSADAIVRTVRSFSLPYLCAKLIFKEHILNIVHAQIVETYLSPEEIKRMEPGKIMNKEDKRIRVKVDDGIVELECDKDLPRDLLATQYIHPPTKYMIEWPKNLFK